MIQQMTDAVTNLPHLIGCIDTRPLVDQLASASVVIEGSSTVKGCTLLLQETTAHCDPERGWHAFTAKATFSAVLQPCAYAALVCFV
jgi:hypothetical protein